MVAIKSKSSNEFSRLDGNLDYYYLQNSSVAVTYDKFFKS